MAPLAGGDLAAYAERGLDDLQPLSDEQSAVVRGSARVRLAVGHPGTGKTGALLYAVRESAPMRQQDLCERLWLDPNNCVLLLNEVEALSYVERRRDPEDRRRHVVDITPEGRRALERAEQAQAGLEGEILGALSEEERETLYRLLSKALEAQRG